MHCPTLKELPPCLAGKTGWPWTEESSQLPDIMEDGCDWPKVSIVTPSYNQGQFIEETIRSVLLQGYPNLEYIIIDGGSIDNSVGVIKKYEKWLAYWVSEKDKGQTHAINKGLKRSHGEIIAYLNSDDMYVDGAIQRAVEYFGEHQDVDILYGDCRIVNERSDTISFWRSQEFDLFSELCRNFIYQPTVFMKRSVLDRVGYFDEGLHYTMDTDYWYRAALHVKFSYVPTELAVFRITGDSKTARSWAPFVHERERVLMRFFHTFSYHTISRWRRQVFGWHHYRAGEQYYEDMEFGPARHQFIKSMRLEPFSLKTCFSVLAIIDSFAHTQFFRRAADRFWTVLRPSKGRNCD